MPISRVVVDVKEMLQLFKDLSPVTSIQRHFKVEGSSAASPDKTLRESMAASVRSGRLVVHVSIHKDEILDGARRFLVLREWSRNPNSLKNLEKVEMILTDYSKAKYNNEKACALFLSLNSAFKAISPGALVHSMQSNVHKVLRSYCNLGDFNPGGRFFDRIGKNFVQWQLGYSLSIGRPGATKATLLNELNRDQQRYVIPVAKSVRYLKKVFEVSELTKMNQFDMIILYEYFKEVGSVSSLDDARLASTMEKFEAAWKGVHDRHVTDETLRGEAVRLFGKMFGTARVAVA